MRGQELQSLASEAVKEQGHKHQHRGAGQQRTEPAAQACCGQLQRGESQVGVAQEGNISGQAEPVDAQTGEQGTGEPVSWRCQRTAGRLRGVYRTQGAEG